jgi:2'-5' RNA ligase
MSRTDIGREPWQEEYAFGAFYIFPPEDLAAKVDALRRIHDPVSAEICQAHISLTEPLRLALDEQQVGEIRNRLSTLKSFTIGYGPIRGNPPHPGIALAIQPAEAVRSLRDAIHSTSAFKGVTFKRADIPPHMTIAEFITLERSAELLHELAEVIPSGSFECAEVVLATPDDDFRFHEVVRFRIGRAM